MMNRSLALLAALCLAGPAAAQTPSPQTQPDAKPAPESKPAPETKKRTADDYRLRLEYHPIGTVVRKGKLRLSNVPRMHPAGFRADDFSFYPSPTYGLGDGWQVSAGVTGAERIGRGGNALFYGLGLQKLLLEETDGRPAISLGAYGMVGPHSHGTGNVYLSATKQVWNRGKHAVFVHGGGKFEFFDGDDYGSGTGLRPYVGLTYLLGRRYSLVAEYSLSQPWQRDDMWAVRATALVYRSLGVSGGFRNNGFDTHGFIGLTLGR
jgi:hypothetical protein